MQAGIPSIGRAPSSRKARGDTPTSSLKRVLKVPSDEQPTSKQMSVTLRSPRRSNAIARSIRRVIRYEYGDSPYACRKRRLRCPADMFTPRASASTSRGCAYSRSMRSRTRRNNTRSLTRSCGVGLLVTYPIVSHDRLLRCASDADLVSVWITEQRLAYPVAVRLLGLGLDAALRSGVEERVEVCDEQRQHRVPGTLGL